MKITSTDTGNGWFMVIFQKRQFFDFGHPFVIILILFGPLNLRHAVVSVGTLAQRFYNHVMLVLSGATHCVSACSTTYPKIKTVKWGLVMTESLVPATKKWFSVYQ